MFSILESKLKRLAQISFLQPLRGTAATGSPGLLAAPLALAISFAATATVVAGPKEPKENATQSRQ